MHMRHESGGDRAEGAKAYHIRLLRVHLSEGTIQIHKTSTTRANALLTEIGSEIL